MKNLHRHRWATLAFALMIAFVPGGLLAQAQTDPGHDERWEEIGQRWQEWGERFGRSFEDADWEAHGKHWEEVGKRWEEWGEQFAASFEHAFDEEEWDA